MTPRTPASAPAEPRRVRNVLLHSGSIYSSDDPFATAMLVTGDRIAWLGSDTAADVHRDAADVIVDLQGALVTPAFVDAHVHSTPTGLALTWLDLTSATSLTQALDMVRAAAETTGPGDVLLGHGWDERRWPDERGPSAAELERAAGGRPAYLTRVDVHTAVASESLLAALPAEVATLAGYSHDGILTRQAHHAARAYALNLLTAGQRQAAQQSVLDHAAASGIGAFHELGGPEISSTEDFTGMLELAGHQVGPEVVGYWGEYGGVDRARELGALGAAGDLFVDGTIGSHTAALRTVYADADQNGHAYLTAAEIRDHVVACTEAGLQAGFHVIGDAAMDATIAGLVEAEERLGASALRARRHRLEHVEMIDDHQLAVLARLGVYASVQPLFDALWGGDDGMYAQRLGRERAERMNPFAEMVAAGVALTLGSDSPVTPMDPWATVQAAAWHRTPHHSISVRSAFAAHTRGGWRAAGRDDAGTLSPGAPAHYAVWRTGELLIQAPDGRVAAWSTDPRSATPGLPDLSPGAPLPTCLRTVVRGQVVYDDGTLDAG